MPFRGLTRQPLPRANRTGNRFLTRFLKCEMTPKLLQNRLRTRLRRLLHRWIAKQSRHDLLRRSHEPIDVGDLTGDGRPDLIVTPDQGGGPRVRVFDGRTGEPALDFFAIYDTNFRGGARAAVGDITGDGVPDLLVAAGFGGGPRVSVWDGTSQSGGSFLRHPFGDFFLFEQNLRNGVYVAVGDLDGGWVCRGDRRRRPRRRAEGLCLERSGSDAGRAIGLGQLLRRRRWCPRWGTARSEESGR